MSPEELRSSFDKALGELADPQSISRSSEKLGNWNWPDVGTLAWWIWVVLLGAVVLSIFVVLVVVYWKSRTPNQTVGAEKPEADKSLESEKADYFDRAKEAWNRGLGDLAASLLYTGVLMDAARCINQKNLFELTSREIQKLLPGQKQGSFRKLAVLHARTRFGARPWTPEEWSQAWDLAQGLRREA